MYEMPVFAAESQRSHFYARFFGPRYENLRRIADKNNIVCNYQPASEVTISFMLPLTELIKIWGEDKNARKAHSDFKSFSEAIIADTETSPRRTRGWSKPDRELTEKQVKRKERAERKLAELRKYQGMPDSEAKFPYVVCLDPRWEADRKGLFDWPQGIDPLKALGSSLEDLDPIRRDCKVYILYSRNFSVPKVPLKAS